jgi:hypothetical protein
MSRDGCRWHQVLVLFGCKIQHSPVESLRLWPAVSKLRSPRNLTSRWGTITAGRTFCPLSPPLICMELSTAPWALGRGRGTYRCYQDAIAHMPFALYGQYWTGSLLHGCTTAVALSSQSHAIFMTIWTPPSPNHHPCLGKVAWWSSSFRMAYRASRPSRTNIH